MNNLGFRYFLVVAKELSFTKAAEKLFISQQSLSAHVQRLEQYYGVELFQRKPLLNQLQKKYLVFLRITLTIQFLNTLPIIIRIFFCLRKSLKAIKN